MTLSLASSLPSPEHQSDGSSFVPQYVGTSCLKGRGLRAAGWPVCLQMREPKPK